MNLKQEILAESIGYKGANFEKNFFFSKLAQGFVKDYKIFKEDTVFLYSEVFGEEYHSIFEEMNTYINPLSQILTEETVLLFEQTPAQLEKEFLNTHGISPKGSVSMGSDPLKNYVPAKEGFKKVVNSATPIVKTGSHKSNFDLAKSMNTGYNKTATFLSKIWDKIKTFGKGLAEKFPKLLPALQKGLSWIIENPFKVIGIAGGSILLGKLLVFLKRRGEDKKAARIQAALNQVKEKEASKEQNIETQKS